MTEDKKKFKGSLSLDWINKEKSLYYEIDEEEGKGIKPFWVDKEDIRVSEPRILNFVQNYGDEASENILVRGDNLLVLRTLVEQFKNREEKDKVKCIYIDPPFNTGSAFDKYDDNLKHSEWLTMMRDRVVLLKKLLRKDGVIFVHIDNNEIAYLKAILDEIFGRENFLQLISTRKATTAGFKAINLCPTTVTEYVLMYSKNRKFYKNKPLYVEVDYNEDYGKIITNPKDDPEKWKLMPLDDEVLKQTPFKDWDEAKEKWGPFWKEIRKSLKASYALENKERVISTKDLHKPSPKIKELMQKSKKIREKVFVLKREKHENIYIINGRSIAFYASKFKVVDGKEKPAELLTNFWDDISWYGIAKEGGVTFKNSKKPEKLLKRIIELGTEKGDLVLDSFLGCGTTSAVAHKIDRRWIGIELGKHAETLCIKRLKWVVDKKNPDPTGISKIVNWRGGDGFKYYKLGESLISNKDINWNLTYEQIAEALFYTKNFKLVENKDFEKKKIFLGENRNEKGVFAICNVSKDLEFIKSDGYFEIVNKLKELPGFKELNIYTNKAVNVRKEDQLENVFIRKIPQTILRRYKLL